MIFFVEITHLFMWQLFGRDCPVVSYVNDFKVIKVIKVIYIGQVKVKIKQNEEKLCKILETIDSLTDIFSKSFNYCYDKELHQLVIFYSKCNKSITIVGIHIIIWKKTQFINRFKFEKQFKVVSKVVITCKFNVCLIYDSKNRNHSNYKSKLFKPFINSIKI